jgi:Cft2 family RNA processing exonuclease
MVDPQNSRVGCSPVFISHGHLDHSAGFKIDSVLKYSSRETMEFVSSYGLQVKNWKPLPLERKVVIDSVEVIPHNSGHVLGSYEFEIVTPEGTILFTGDFNTETTKTMKPAEPVSCDILVLESTFGSPSFVFPAEESVGKDMVDWAEKIMGTGRIPAFQTDPLGNAQEVTGIFNETAIPVVTHWKVSRISKVYEAHGHKMEYFDAKSAEAEEIVSSGNCVFITPKQLDLQNHPEFVPALVSGWALWSKRTAFPLSDHADFPRLVKFVTECNPKIVLTCHGNRFAETLARYIEKKLRIRAYPIKLIPTALHSEL